MTRDISSVLRPDERYLLRLRSLFESYGYRRYKMSRFEEYDLYQENKSFLGEKNIITFSEPGGRLLALKPDITLSIVKSARDTSLSPDRVYYTENVYRTQGSFATIKEIMQAGVEFIGDVDAYACAEVLTLACRSLAAIGDRYILSISHMGILSSVTGELPEELRHRASVLISEKNTHAIRAMCAESNVPSELCEKMCLLSSLYGSFAEVMPKIEALCGADNAGYTELAELAKVLSASGFEQNVKLDFSVMNDMEYYGGVIFQGFVAEIPKCVLSGGRYDRLVEKFGKAGGAVGFAISMDMLEHYFPDDAKTDCVLILYSADDDVSALTRAAERLSADGSCIQVQKVRPADVSGYKKVLRMKGGVLVEEND